MNPSSQQPPSDPERMLRAQLKETSPAFEQRWTDLKRRLRTEPARQPYVRGIRWWWTVLPLGASLVAMSFVLRPHFQGPRTLPPDDVSAYVDLLELDADLRDAIPLANAETTETLLLISNSDLEHS